jgi:GTP-binding protein HflX
MLADRVLQVREEAAREEVEGQDDTYWMSPDDDAQY